MTSKIYNLWMWGCWLLPPHSHIASSLPKRGVQGSWLRLFGNFLLDSLAPSLAGALAHSVASTVQPAAHHADTPGTWSILVLGEAEKNSNWKSKANHESGKRDPVLLSPAFYDKYKNCTKIFWSPGRSRLNGTRGAMSGKSSLSEKAAQPCRWQHTEALAFCRMHYPLWISETGWSIVKKLLSSKIRLFVTKHKCFSLSDPRPDSGTAGRRPRAHKDWVSGAPCGGRVAGRGCFASLT